MEFRFLLTNILFFLFGLVLSYLFSFRYLKQDESEILTPPLPPIVVKQVCDPVYFSENGENWDGSGRYRPITISGHGCEECNIGETCYMRITIEKNGIFALREDIVWHDFLISIKGPALISVEMEKFHVRPRKENVTGFNVLYTPHLPGNYTATVEVFSQWFEGNSSPHESTKIDSDTSLTRLAEFSIKVTNESVPAGALGLREFGHWVKNQSAELNYTFTELPEGPRLLTLEKSVGKLVKKGVQVISFVGDSHLRESIKHVEFLLKGGIDRYDDFHENYSVEIPDRFSNKSLTLKLIWVEGIYPFGQCNSGGLNSTFKGADPLSDLVIIDAGSWTLARCKDAIPKFVKNVDPFARKIKKSVKDKAKIFWRSTPPVPLFTAYFKLDRRSSSRLVFNKLQRIVAESHGFTYVDLWPIESTFFNVTLRPRDAHLSLEGKGHIGEAGLRVLFHILANS